MHHGAESPGPLRGRAWWCLQPHDGGHEHGDVTGDCHLRDLFALIIICLSSDCSYCNTILGFTNLIAPITSGLKYQVCNRRNVAPMPIPPPPSGPPLPPVDKGKGKGKGKGGKGGKAGCLLKPQLVPRPEINPKLTNKILNVKSEPLNKAPHHAESPGVNTAHAGKAG